MVKVTIKWQKELLKDVDLDFSQPPVVFKTQLYTLTGVAPERQKIMVKGGILQDDADWSLLGIKEGQKLMMMGSADQVPVAPEKATVFMEDLPEEEQGGALPGISTAGLQNLGNTCYMNSTLQCLHGVPELNKAIQSYRPSSSASLGDIKGDQLASAAHMLFSQLDRSLSPIVPLNFLMLLREKFPQFAERTNAGFMQQDAEECWSQLVHVLSRRLKGPSDELVVDKLFGIELATELKCAESGEASTEKELVHTFKCHISLEVNHLHEGLQLGLKGELEKTSPALNRMAVYTKTSRINQLPMYLNVQFVRFFWKREEGGAGHKAKILRKVGFPLVLDTLDFCTEELKAKLQRPRQVWRAMDEKINGPGKAAASSDPPAGTAGASAPASMEVDPTPVAPAAAAAATESTSAAAAAAADAPPPVAADKASTAEAPAVASTSSSAKEPEVTGMYDLTAVLTHKGRSADSGHYVSWVKQANGSWIEFDDDKPIPRREEDIVKLSGGGDWHMAYILVYKARTVVLP